VNSKSVGLAVALAFAMLAPITAAAQPVVKMAHIGILSSHHPPSSPQYLRPRFDAFLQGLRELGYGEGQNIAIEWRFAAGRDDKLPALAAELVQRKVDVIVTTTTPATVAAQQATGTIPIVMAGLADPVRSGLVASLARPGRNTTGLTQVTGEVYGKRVEIFKQAVPGLTRLAVVYNPTNRPSVDDWKETETAARSMGVEVLPVEARDAGEIESAFPKMIKGRVHGVIVTADAQYVSERARMSMLALRAGLPTMFWTREFAEVGGLMTYGTNAPHLYRRAAAYVDKILKGARPSDLPVEQPTIFELVINLKTGKALGLTIPQSVLLRADDVIQ
jgi:putative tryptophan/tyrosine transport system substrate-binding protein